MSTGTEDAAELRVSLSRLEKLLDDAGGFEQATDPMLETVVQESLWVSEIRPCR